MPANLTTTGPQTSTGLTAAYKETLSVRNAHLVLQAVAERFPDWAPECQPFVNVLTLREWNRRGYSVKKGEKAIRVGTLVPAYTVDATTGETVPAGDRWERAYLFALPQVQKRPHHVCLCNSGRFVPVS